MAWMKRRDNSGGEQKDYLNAADTAGRPMALASILFTLLFIAAIALLIFSAGRWAYNQMIDQEITVTTTQQQEATSSATESTQTEEASTTTEVTSTDESVTSTIPSTNGSSAAESTSATTPATVPNTGTGSVLGIFIVSVILASLAHHRWQVVKNR